MITNYPLVDTGEWGKKYEYNKDSNYFAFAGQISETYKLSFIAETIQDVNVRLAMCGPEKCKGCYEQIKEKDVNDKIEYLGKLQYDQIPSFLGGAKCAFVLTDYGSNTGWKIGTLGNNKLFEAMLFGVPVICTDFILWKKIISKNRCGICVNPNDREQLIDAINYIVDNQDEAEEMGANGRRAILNKFNWNSQEIVMRKMYSHL